MTVRSTVNAPFRKCLPEEKLAEILNSGRENPEYRFHIQVFFSEVPVIKIIEFAREYGISLKKLKQYYLNHIKELFPNPELEEALRYD